MPMSLDDALARLADGTVAKAVAPRVTPTSRGRTAGKVLLEIDGQPVEGLIRNIALSGAMIEAPGQIAPGTQLELHIAEEGAIFATVRWAEEGRIGVEFAAPITIEKPRRILASALAVVGIGDTEEIRRAG